ncbi:MAG: monovalent cation/H(+) antiporter subunit G [Oscillospiraceae bacterium]|nr:monovalent cation/H(+) antiporter subunit G [Oscillospiraceae bacterium]
MRIVIDLLIAAGLVFATAGTLGILKMPDTFSRMQAATCISTLGVLLLALGGILYAAVMMHSAASAIKIAVIALMVLVTNPVGSHVIAKGAYSHGIRPETKMDTDDLGRDFDE